MIGQTRGYIFLFRDMFLILLSVITKKGRRGWVIRFHASPVLGHFVPGPAVLGPAVLVARARPLGGLGTHPKALTIGHSWPSVSIAWG